jgi:hypothetical protein
LWHRIEVDGEGSADASTPQGKRGRLKREEEDGFNFKTRILDEILYIVGKKYSSIITRINFVTPFIHRYNNRFLAMLWKFFLISNRTDKLVDLRL